tara:strand:+ start:101 stop:235 length:135 start_codon:yes stop_codon:yes gene_type:complete
MKYFIPLMLFLLAGCVEVGGSSSDVCTGAACGDTTETTTENTTE